MLPHNEKLVSFLLWEETVDDSLQETRCLGGEDSTEMASGNNRKGKWKWGEDTKELVILQISQFLFDGLLFFLI